MNFWYNCSLWLTFKICIDKTQESLHSFNFYPKAFIKHRYFSFFWYLFSLKNTIPSTSIKSCYWYKLQSIEREWHHGMEGPILDIDSCPLQWHTTLKSWHFWDQISNKTIYAIKHNRSFFFFPVYEEYHFITFRTNIVERFSLYNCIVKWIMDE